MVETRMSASCIPWPPVTRGGWVTYRNTPGVLLVLESKILTKSICGGRSEGCLLKDRRIRFDKSLSCPNLRLTNLVHKLEAAGPRGQGHDAPVDLAANGTLLCTIG